LDTALSTGGIDITETKNEEDGGIRMLKVEDVVI
jgi:hypothetical protein